MSTNRMLRPACAESTCGTCERCTAEFGTPGASKASRSCKHESSSHAAGGRAAGIGPPAAVARQGYVAVSRQAATTAPPRRRDSRARFAEAAVDHVFADRPTRRSRKHSERYVLVEGGLALCHARHRRPVSRSGRSRSRESVTNSIGRKRFRQDAERLMGIFLLVVELTERSIGRHRCRRFAHHRIWALRGRRRLGNLCAGVWTHARQPDPPLYRVRFMP
jgi:hypothetical protein